MIPHVQHIENMQHVWKWQVQLQKYTKYRLYLNIYFSILK